LNVRRVSDVRQIEILIAKLLVPDPSPFEVEIAIGKLKRYKSPGSDEILAELIQARSETLRSDIHKLINSIWNKEELPDQWKDFIIAPIYKKDDNLAVVIVVVYHCYQLHTKFYPIFFSQV
jgi:hypothetical protein